MMQDGWKNYLKETSQNKVLDKLSNANKETTDQVFKKIENELTNVKYKVFGKVSVGKKKKGVNKINDIQNRKHNLEKAFSGETLRVKREEIDVELKTAIEEIQYEAFSKEIKKLNSIKATKGTSAAVFKLRTGVLGSSKSSSDPVIINDPISGVPLMTPTDIKSATLKYCVILLTNRQPKEGYTDIIKRKESLHELRMNEVIHNDILVLTPEMYHSAFQYLMKKNGAKYKFLINGGMSLHNALYNLFLIIYWKVNRYLRRGIVQS